MSTAASDLPRDTSIRAETPLRFVTAASLFDGHDAAINIMRRLIQARGVEVIHLGHNRSVQDIVDAAVQEDADAIAVSSYQGGHMEFFRYIVDLLAERGAGHIKVFGGGGGVIVPDEIAALHAAIAGFCLWHAEGANIAVTNVTTRRGARKLGGTGKLEGGSDNTFERQASAGGSTDRVNYSLGVTHIDTDGDSVTPARLRNGVSAEDDNYANWTTSARLGIALSDTLDVNFFGRYIDSETDLDPELESFGFGTTEDRDAEQLG